MKIIDKLFDFAIAMAVAVISVITITQVFARYIFDLPIGWADDVIRISFIYLIFFGAAIAVRDKSHLNIDFLTSVMPEKVYKIVEFFSALFILFFLSYVIVYGYKFTLASTTQNLPYLRIPMSILYAAIPLSAVFMLIYLLKDIHLKIKGLFMK